MKYGTKNAPETKEEKIMYIYCQFDTQVMYHSEEVAKNMVFVAKHQIIDNEKPI